MSEVKIRTGVWYDDRSITLNFPDSFDVATYWPDTPQPLSDKDIVDKINAPVGQPPIIILAKNKKRPIIIVDDLSRPTPVFKIMPFILEQLCVAGIPKNAIKIIVATGTHGEQNIKALNNKIGKEAMDSCQVIVHNDKKNNKYIGKTSLGTPVYVNNEVVSSDFVIGISGVYPQHTTGFGGGSKLALGVLGHKSIMYLHYRHKGVGGTYDIDNNFRKDVTEIARMIDLNTIYTLHIDAQLELVNLICGDHFQYYPQAAKFSREKYSAPLPDDADVVITNAYPFDISFTFMRKAYKPLEFSNNNSTKIMIASNYEGIGVHGFFPHMNPPRLIKYRNLYNRISTMKLDEIIIKILKRLSFKSKNNTSDVYVNVDYAMPRNVKRLLLYIPHNNNIEIPQVEGINIKRCWSEICEIILKDHPTNDNIKICVYPCAPIQCLETNQK